MPACLPVCLPVCLPAGCHASSPTCVAHCCSYLSRNTLTGPIPESLGDIEPLIELDLSFNQLSGAIPATLGSLKNLEA
ncbi:unnamed protein product, partial [Closterium sp. NIES-54]